MMNKNKIRRKINLKRIKIKIKQVKDKKKTEVNTTYEERN